MEFKEAVDFLLNNGGKLVESVEVIDATVGSLNECGSRNVTLILDKPVQRYIADKNGNYTVQESNMIVTTDISLRGLMRQYPNLTIAVKSCKEVPERLELIYIGSKIDIIEEQIVNGQQYTNPFSNNGNTVIFDHDTIIHHIVNIVSFSKEANETIGLMKKNRYAL